MSRNVGILMLLSLLGCGAAQDPSRLELSLSDAGPPPTSACARDADCNDGMICEGCGDGVFTCVPGCRTDAECGANRICNHQVACLTCPCPSGLCDLDPCRDLDGDGFAAQLSGTCPGKQVGDCNDGNPATYPGGHERCANGADDDCDGKTDTNDTECRVCSQNQSYCQNSYSCGGGRFCEQGCCEVCPVPAPPQCPVDRCMLPAGVDANGCSAGFVCGDCAQCPSNYEPVCGKNFGTYHNACLAQLAGTEVLHTGECSWGEGARCAGLGDCSYNQYCRDLGGEQHCALVGTCSTDADCRFVTSVASCGDAGVTANWVCRNERCAAQCP